MLVFTLGVVLFVAGGAFYHFGKNAAKAPNVNGLVVVFLNKDDLWWSVPSRGDMIRKAPLLLHPSLSIALLLASNLGPTIGRALREVHGLVNLRERLLI